MLPIRQLQKIQSMGGLESYIDNVHLKKRKKYGKLLIPFFGLSGLVMTPVALFAFDDGIEIIMLIIGLACIVLAIIAAIGTKERSQVSPNEYKEKLQKRYGNHSEILKTIEGQLYENDITVTECGAYVTKDWLVLLDAKHPLEFIPKAEIACVLAAHTTFLIWDNGQVFDMTFGQTMWNHIFQHLTSENTYIISNDDMIVMPDGKSLPAIKAYQTKGGKERIIETFNNNKKDSILHP